MKAIFTSLAIAAASVFAPAAHAQRVMQTVDVERPTAQNIVSAHCVVNPASVCNVYTVPAGKILHVTQVSYIVAGAAGGFLVWSAGSNFTSLFYALPNGYVVGTDKVDFYLPPGFAVTATIQNAGPGGIDVSLFGVLSDQ